MAHDDAREGKMGKLANGMGSQYSTHYLGTWCIQHDAHTSAASSRLNWRPLADLNGLVRFAERRNLVSARVQSHFSWPLPTEENAGWAPQHASTSTTPFYLPIIEPLISGRLYHSIRSLETHLFYTYSDPDKHTGNKLYEPYFIYHACRRYNKSYRLPALYDPLHTHKLWRNKKL